MRSLSLAHELRQRGHSVVFVSRKLSDQLENFVGSASTSVHHLSSEPYGRDDASEVLSLSPDLIVTDGYGFCREFYEELGDVRYVVIDDNGETKADSPSLLVNQNPHADPDFYQHFRGSSRLLLGLPYCLLRTQICQLTPRNGERVLVSFGGSDPLGLGMKVAKFLSQYCPVDISAGSVMEDVERNEVDLSSNSIRLISAQNFARSLSECRVAVVGAGTTIWEAWYFKKPVLGVIVAENQRGLANWVATSCGVPIYDYLSGDQTGNFERLSVWIHNVLFSKSISKTRVQIDGYGVGRVAKEIELLFA